MFKRLRLWYWKWFQPSRYGYYLGQQAAAGFKAGLERSEL